LSLRVARRSDSLKALQEGRADYCLGVFPRLPTGVAAKVVARTTMTLVTRKGDDPIAQSARLLVAPRGSALRSLLRRSTFAAEWQNVLECPTCEAALDLARLGAAPALVHTICAPRDEDGLQTRDLGEKQGLMQLVVAYRRGARHTRAQQAFFDLLTA
jgi:DNA-binding transcriptional LysR family regulator